MMRRTRIALLIGAASLAVVGAYLLFLRRAPQAGAFDGQRAYQDVVTQVAFGPRIPGTQGHAREVDWIREELSAAGWDSRIQDAQIMGHPIRNIIASRGDALAAVLVAAHYDTRIYADNDPDASLRSQPVPGANDGASGVGVLLELARQLPPGGNSVWLVFLDAEDNGRIPGWDWILGSQAMAGSLTFKPRAMVLVDMIGDTDLNIYEERNSDPALTDSLWNQAAALGYGSQFIAQPKYTVLDDHVPFIQAGIASVDIIDLDYPYWHTTADTPDKLSAASLQAVGETLLRWLMEFTTRRPPGSRYPNRPAEPL